MALLLLVFSFFLPSPRTGRSRSLLHWCFLFIFFSSACLHKGCGELTLVCLPPPRFHSTHTLSLSLLSPFSLSLSPFSTPLSTLAPCNHSSGRVALARGWRVCWGGGRTKGRERTAGPGGFDLLLKEGQVAAKVCLIAFYRLVLFSGGCVCVCGADKLELSQFEEECVL